MSVIRTQRLLLRAFELADAEPFAALASDRAIADTMISIPHPLTDDFVAAWVASGVPTRWAVCETVSGHLLGAVELRDIDPEHRQAELSFWVGRPFWGRGYASEAGAVVVHHAFGTLGLNRVYALHMARNPASGRVLAKLGMQKEGVLRQRIRKWGRFEDVHVWAVLRSDLAESG